MGDALLIGRLIVAVGNVGAPIASLWTIDVEQPPDVRREIAKRVGFALAAQLETVSYWIQCAERRCNTSH